VSTLLGLVAIGMMTRYLGQAQFGWYVTVISFLGFAGILIDFGLIPVTAQMMSEPKFDKTVLFKNLLGFRFVTAFVFFGIIPFLAWLFPYPREVNIAIGFVSLSFLAISMNQVLIGFYQTKLKMHVQVIGEVFGRLVLIAGLFLVITNALGFLPVMGVVTLASLSYTAMLWLNARRYAKTGFAFDAAIWKSISIKMWPIAVSIMFNVVYLKGDVLILSVFRDQVEVGLYGAAYRVIDILAQTAMMIMGVMLPLLAYAWSRKDTKTFQQRYQQSFDVMMMLALPMTVGLMLTANQIMAMIGGREFVASGKPLQILAIAVFGVYLGGVFGHAAVAINKQKQTMWVYMSNAVITLIGYGIFIPRYGMWGAAWMTVFSELYAGIFLFLIIRYYSKTKLSLVVFGKILLATILMGGTVYYYVPTMHVLISIALGGVVYGTVLVVTGGISQSTIREVVRFR